MDSVKLLELNKGVCDLRKMNGNFSMEISTNIILNYLKMSKERFVET